MFGSLWVKQIAFHNVGLIQSVESLNETKSPASPEKQRILQQIAFRLHLQHLLTVSIADRLQTWIGTSAVLGLQLFGQSCRFWMLDLPAFIIVWANLFKINLSISVSIFISISIAISYCFCVSEEIWRIQIWYRESDYRGMKS